MDTDQRPHWPDDPAQELQFVFEMFEQVWEIACSMRPGRRERTACLVNYLRNQLLRPAQPPRRGQPQLRIIQGGA